MNRDGSTKSIWQEKVEGFQPQNAWDKEQVYDVLIIGGGITGLTTALTLQEKGKKCILAEAHNVGFGSSGGTTAHLNTLLDTPYYKVAKNFGDEAAKQLAVGAREGLDLIEGFVSKYHIDCDLAYKPGYLFAETEEQADELEKIKEGNDKVFVLNEWADSIPVPVPFVKALKVDFQGQLHATKYLNGLAKAFEQNGGVILQHCLVSDLSEDVYVTAETSLGTIKASLAIYATHIPPGINIFSFRCAPYRSYAMAFTLKSGNYPDGLAYDCQDPYNYYRTHTIEGQNYVIAGGYDHKTGHNENTEHSFIELEAHVRKYFDVETVSYKWSSQYYNSVDGLPYIGLMPGYEYVYVATGFAGNGFTYGSLAAKVICELISRNHTPYEDLFDPARIKVIAGFSNFVKENADVIAQFVSKRFSYRQITQLVDLAPGEATIAEWENNKVALYKDERGHIYALDPVCTHAKCIVGWNNAEKTWDCPCHGARYAPNGDLLSGPARHSLMQIKWEDIEGD
jgi:glycine/D-amino acid oxidase-like deaminating enzyme/nitrite reductase/ring-hydroxylating ferredoxin subunit